MVVVIVILLFMGCRVLFFWVLNIKNNRYNISSLMYVVIIGGKCMD